MTFMCFLLKSQPSRGFNITTNVEGKTVKEMVEIGSSYQYFGCTNTLFIGRRVIEKGDVIMISRTRRP